MGAVAIIINLKAKNAESIKPYLEQFDAAKIAYDFYQVEPEELSSVIKDCVSRYSIILIGGGDGSIRTAAQYCANTPILLGVLLLGTMNHFAKELGLPQTSEELITALEHQQKLLIDLAEVNGLVFLNNSSIGFYPKFAKKRDGFSKHYNKWLSYIPSFIESLKKHEVFDLQIKSKSINCVVRTSFLMVSNNLYSFEFPLTVKRESFEKSVLGLYYFKQGKIQLLKILQGWFRNKKNFAIEESKHPIEIHIKQHEEVTISLDGDTVKTHTPLHYKVLSKSLNILVRPQ